jgi:hypothetical protein
MTLRKKSLIRNEDLFVSDAWRAVGGQGESRNYWIATLNAQNANDGNRADCSWRVLGMFVGGWWMELKTGEADKWRQTEVLRDATPLRLPPHRDGYMTYDNISALSEGRKTSAINVTVTPTWRRGIPTHTQNKIRHCDFYFILQIYIISEFKLWRNTSSRVFISSHPLPYI